ncbi:MAG TPA: hypothetical protein VF297_26015 [Pyrinomonadaceae bacterium]
MSLEVRRRAPLGREELRRQLLALVLAFVLVWYTLVVPVGAASPRRYEPDDDGHDGEVRGVKSQATKSDSTPVEELDWPEYIYP